MLEEGFAFLGFEFRKAPIFASATATGHSTRWTGLFGANCSYGSGVSTNAPGGLLRNDGDISSFMTDAGCIEWWGK